MEYEDPYENFDYGETLGTRLERFYLCLLDKKDPQKLIDAYVSLEAYCPNPQYGETWEVQDEIVRDARRKSANLIRIPYVERINTLITAARKRLKVKAALDHDTGAAHSQRYMNVILDVLGTWSNILLELRSYGFRREMIATLMSNLYPRIIEMVWDAFQIFKQDKDLDMLCARAMQLNESINLHALDNTLQQLITIRSLLDQHYTFHFQLFTPYFLIEHECEDSLAALSLLERLVLVPNNDELHKWKEIDFIYSALEAAYLLRAVSEACEDHSVLEIEEGGVFMLQFVEDVLFLLQKVSDRAISSAQENVVFTLGHRLLDLVAFGQSEALIYVLLSSHVVFKYSARKKEIFAQEHVLSMISACTGKDYHPHDMDPLSKSEGSSQRTAPGSPVPPSGSNSTAFRTPGKPPLPPSHRPVQAASDASGPNGTDGSGEAGEEGLEVFWKEANSWFSNWTSPYISRHDLSTQNNNGDSEPPAQQPLAPNTGTKPDPPSVSTFSTPAQKGGVLRGASTPLVPTTSTLPTPNGHPTNGTGSVASLEELLLRALDVDDGDHTTQGQSSFLLGVDGNGNCTGSKLDVERDALAVYDPFDNDVFYVTSSASSSSSAAVAVTISSGRGSGELAGLGEEANAFVGTLAQGANSASSSNIGVAGGLSIFAATSSLVSVFLDTAAPLPPPPASSASKSKLPVSTVSSSSTGHAPTAEVDGRLSRISSNGAVTAGDGSDPSSSHANSISSSGGLKSVTNGSTCDIVNLNPRSTSPLPSALVTMTLPQHLEVYVRNLFVSTHQHLLPAASSSSSASRRKSPIEMEREGGDNSSHGKVPGHLNQQEGELNTSSHHNYSNYNAGAVTMWQCMPLSNLTRSGDLLLNDDDLCVQLNSLAVLTQGLHILVQSLHSLSNVPETWCLTYRAPAETIPSGSNHTSNHSISSNGNGVLVDQSSCGGSINHSAASGNILNKKSASLVRLTEDYRTTVRKYTSQIDRDLRAFVLRQLLRALPTYSEAQRHSSHSSSSSQADAYGFGDLGLSGFLGMLGYDNGSDNGGRKHRLRNETLLRVTALYLQRCVLFLFTQYTRKR